MAVGYKLEGHVIQAQAGALNTENRSSCSALFPIQGKSMIPEFEFQILNGNK